MGNGLLIAAGSGGNNNTLGQNDRFHVADITKLVSIANAINFEYPDDIQTISVKPACILQSQLDDIKEISLCITLVDGDDYNHTAEASTNIDMLLRAFIRDEYPEIADRVSIKFSEKDAPASLTLLTKCVIDPYTIDDLMELDLLTTLMAEEDVKVSISKNWANEYHTTILLHLPENGNVIDLNMKMSVLRTPIFKMSINQSLPYTSDEDTYNYVPVIGYDIPYNLPYVQLNSMSLNEQVLEDYLKPKVDDDHM